MENSVVATSLEKVGFHSYPKERQCQRMFKLSYNELISHASKIMIKILQARLQYYVNWELPDVQAGFRKGRGTRGQIASIFLDHGEIRVPVKHLLPLHNHTNAFDSVDHNKLWKAPKEMGIPDHLTWLLRNLYAGQEATVRTRHETDWFKIGKAVRQGCVLSSC